jgi:hypothetical protein
MVIGDLHRLAHAPKVERLELGKQPKVERGRDGNFRSHHDNTSSFGTAQRRQQELREVIAAQVVDGEEEMESVRRP